MRREKAGLPEAAATRLRRFRRWLRRDGAAALHEGADALRYSRDPARLTAGNSLEPLIDGDEAFPAMLDAIEAARTFVHLETYILADDEVGRLFSRALRSRARAGVAVRVLFDSIGSLLLPASFVEELEDSGVQVVEFRPLRRFLFRRHWSRRDHRKVLVVDGRLGFTGGLNVSSEYASVGKEGRGWCDTHLKAEGPVVSQLEALFRATWHRAGGAPYPAYRELGLHSTHEEGAMLAAAVASDGGRKSVIRRHYLHAFVSARESILIANAYFVPDRGLLRALRRAARRGVRVAVIVPAESDVFVVQRASERLYDRLLRSGVELYQWPRTHMHAKTAVVDGVWSVVGSYNLDSVSLFNNLEVVIECVDQSFGREMGERFEIDLESASPVELELWRRRPLHRRWSEWLAYQLQRWL